MPTDGFVSLFFIPTPRPRPRQEVPEDIKAILATSSKNKKKKNKKKKEGSA